MCLHSNHHHQQTNTQFLQASCPSCRPTNSVGALKGSGHVPVSDDGELKLNGSVKEPNMFRNYKTEKITRKASDMAENPQLYPLDRFFHPRSLCTMTHLMLFSERLLIFALSCMMI